MQMDVKTLIAALRKMPANARVVIADHDHDSDAGEYNASPKWVALATDKMKARGYEVVIGT